MYQGRMGVEHLEIASDDNRLIEIFYLIKLLLDLAATQFYDGEGLPKIGLGFNHS